MRSPILRQLVKRFYLIPMFAATLLIMSPSASAQDVTFDFVGQFGGDDRNQAVSVTVDGDGNSYVSGRFRATADLDPGSGVMELTSGGSDDVFVAKLDSAGALIWLRTYGGSLLDEVTSIALDGSGNVYTAGTFSTTADFDPGEEEANFTTRGSSDCYISKLDNDGNFLWARAFGNSSADNLEGMELDDAGNVYVTGFFRGTLDLDPSGATFNVTSLGDTDAYVCSLDVDGNFRWGGAFLGTERLEGFGIAVDGNDSVYVTGRFQGSVDFDPSEAEATIASTGTTDIYITKLTTAGAFVWARAFLGSGAGCRGGW